ncbi:DUF2093 domain-containing protein [Hellea sp.]|nr:DUF2093 domain-containing protein [Hellea sp.]
MDLSFKNSGEAKVHYGESDFTILKDGIFVFCAITKEKIPLHSLRYWSSIKQEAYKDAQASLVAWKKDH